MVSPHGVPWPTPVSGKVVYIIFQFLIFKTYTYYVLKMYMYYETNTGGLWLRLDSGIVKEGFQANPWLLKEIDP